MKVGLDSVFPPPTLPPFSTTLAMHLYRRPRPVPVPVPPPQPRIAPLLDLPYEILADIVGYVAEAESEELEASAVVGHRLVCRK